MSFDRRNAPMVRTGYVLTEKTSSDIAEGDAGIWNSSDKLLSRKADGRDVGIMRSEGVIPSARLVMSQQPTDADTIGIGGKTFTFVASLGAAGATVQVKIGASAAATLGSLVKAINGTAAALEWVEASTPFAVAVVADAVSTSLRIRKATERGGTAIAGTLSCALAEAITHASDIWNCSNLNVSGKAATDCRMSHFQVAIEATQVTAGSFQIELPFTPTAFQVFVTSSAGVQRASTDAVTISSNALSIALGGGASPAIQAGDLVRGWAIE